MARTFVSEETASSLSRLTVDDGVAGDARHTKISSSKFKLDVLLVHGGRMEL